MFVYIVHLHLALEKSDCSRIYIAEAQSGPEKIFRDLRKPGVIHTDGHRTRNIHREQPPSVVDLDPLTGYADYNIRRPIRVFKRLVLKNYMPYEDTLLRQSI